MEISRIAAMHLRMPVVAAARSCNAPAEAIRRHNVWSGKTPSECYSACMKG
jgi:hypothetical protein